MTTLKERLTRKIEIDAEKWADEKNKWSDDPSYACDYIAGALSLIPLIEELAIGLDKVKPSLNIAFEDTNDLYYKNVEADVDESLQSIERFIGDDFYPEPGADVQPNLNDNPESIEESW